MRAANFVGDIELVNLRQAQVDSLIVMLNLSTFGERRLTNIDNQTPRLINMPSQITRAVQRAFPREYIYHFPVCY
jgi:hypothetical protein